jgi:hypothetical protein
LKRNSTSNKGGYRRNHGQPGVVYILENPGLRSGWWKIGCSTRSGAVRAKELNDEATTGTPGVFRCVFEVRTLDCGRAEERVFQDLAIFRRGKQGQEYFELQLSVAQTSIRRVCSQIDASLAPPPPPPPPPQPPPAPAIALQANVPQPTATQPLVPPVAPVLKVRAFMCGSCSKVMNINEQVICWRPRCEARKLHKEIHGTDRR